MGLLGVDCGGQPDLVSGTAVLRKRLEGDSQAVSRLGKIVPDEEVSQYRIMYNVVVSGINTYLYVCMYICVSMYVCIYESMNICMYCIHVCMCIYVCKYVSMYVCMYMCKYLSIYVCMYSGGSL